MNRDAKFWVGMGVFQLVFGLAIFGITRDYYLEGRLEGRGDLDGRSGGNRSAAAPSTSARASAVPPIDFSPPKIPRLGSNALDASAPRGPGEISRQAEMAFGAQQYEKAAGFYRELLAIVPDDAETHNNLGLTLHYLGRSKEALRALNEGVRADPEHQRIRLTLGYVNKQLGNDEAARKALMDATMIGSDAGIRKSAMEMLRDLP